MKEKVKKLFGYVVLVIIAVGFGLVIVGCYLGDWAKLEHQDFPR